MSTALDHMAARVATDPLFLAHALTEYARSEGLDDDGLASALCCSRDDLTRLRLCGVPRTDPHLFRSDVEAIATRFNLDWRTLTDVVRRGLSIARLRVAPPVSSEPGAVIAAREDLPSSPEESTT
jgi:hypothetical protein